MTPPLDIEQELQLRLEQLTPADMVRGIFIKGVLEVARRLGGVSLEQECLKAAGEKTFVDFFSYPSAMHLKAIYQAARWLRERYGGFDEALWQMGHVGTRAFFTSAVGRSMRVIGGGHPARLLNALPAAFSLSGATLKSELKWTGARSAVFTLKRDVIPAAYTEGVLHAVLEQAQVKAFQVSSHKPELLVGEYTLSWEE